MDKSQHFASVVLELQMKISVRFAPQKWLPCGKAWFNADQCKPGDQLDGDVKIKVVAVQAPYISVSAAISRKTAASLYKAWVEADPAVWAPHFLDQWNTYWQRDATDELPPGSQEFLDLVAQVDSAPLKPLDYDLWQRVVRAAKPNSMRGVDGWSFAELKMVPRAFVEVLLQLYSWFEQVEAWPRVFKVWLVILLRKVPEGILP